MKYYRMQVNGRSEFVAVPSEEYLDAVAHYLYCKRTPDVIYDEYFEGRLAHVELDALEELSQVTYRAIKGDAEIEEDFTDCTLHEGDLPDGWDELIRLVYDHKWNDDIAINDDLRDMVDNDICNYGAFHEMLLHCTGTDPEVYADVHSRYLYGEAIKRLKERGVIIVWGDFAQEYVERWDKDSEIPLSVVIDNHPTIKIFNTAAESEAYKMGLRDTYNRMRDAGDDVCMEFVDVDYLV